MTGTERREERVHWAGGTAWAKALRWSNLDLLEMQRRDQDGGSWVKSMWEEAHFQERFGAGPGLAATWRK